MSTVAALDEAIRQLEVPLAALKIERLRLTTADLKDTSRSRTPTIWPRVRVINLPESYYEEISPHNDPFDHRSVDFAIEKINKILLDDRVARNHANTVLPSLREGDILNTQGSYYFVYRDEKTRKLYLALLEGDDPYILPIEALPTLHRFKLEAAEDISRIYSTKIVGVDVNDDLRLDENVYSFAYKDGDTLLDAPVFKLKEHPLPK